MLKFVLLVSLAAAAVSCPCDASFVLPTTALSEPYESATVAPANLQRAALSDRSLSRPRPIATTRKPMSLAKPMPQGGLARPLAQAATRPNRPSALLRRHAVEHAA